MKRHIFGNVRLLFSILVPSMHKNTQKKIILGLLFRLYINAFPCIFLRNKFKNNQNTRFWVKLYCFSTKGFYMLVSVLVILFYFTIYGISMLFIVLVSTTLINTLKTRLSKYRFLYPCRMLCMHFGVLIPDCEMHNDIVFLQIECYWYIWLL